MPERIAMTGFGLTPVVSIRLTQQSYPRLLTLCFNGIRT